MDMLLKIILAILGLFGILLLAQVLKFPPSFYENQEKFKKLRDKLEKEQELS